MDVNIYVVQCKENDDSEYRDIGAYLTREEARNKSTCCKMYSRGEKFRVMKISGNYEKA